MTGSANPFTQTEQSRRRTVQQSGFDTGIVDRELDEMVRVRLKSGTAKRCHYITNSQPQADETVLLQDDIVVGRIGTSDSDDNDDSDGGGTGGGSEEIFLGPDTQYVTNNYPWDGSDGFTFVKGPEHETVPEGYYGENVGTTAQLTGYAWFGWNYPTENLVFDFSSVDASAVRFPSVPSSTAQYRITDDETGEILVEHGNVSGLGTYVFDLSDVSGVFRIEPLDISQMSLAVSSAVKPLDVEGVGWQRPYSDLPNYADSGDGQSWNRGFQKDGGKSGSTSATSITEDFEERYTFFSNTIGGIAFFANGSFSLYESDQGFVAAASRETKDIEWRQPPDTVVGNLFDSDGTNIMIASNFSSGSYVILAISDGSVVETGSMSVSGESIAGTEDIYLYNDGFVAVHTYNSNRHAKRYGSTTWETQLSEYYDPQSCVAADVGSLCYMASHGSDGTDFAGTAAIDVVDLSSGTIENTIDYNDTAIVESNGSIITYDGSNFYTITGSTGGSNHLLFEIDATTGSDSIISSSITMPSGFDENDLRLLVDDTYVYVVSDDGIVALDKTDGSTGWRHDDSGSFLTAESVIVDGAGVIYNDDNEGLVRLDKSDGSLTQLIAETSNVPLAAFENELYAGTEGGNIVKYVEVA